MAWRSLRSAAAAAGAAAGAAASAGGAAAATAAQRLLPPRAPAAPPPTLRAPPLRVCCRDVAAVLHRLFALLAEGLRGAAASEDGAAGGGCDDVSFWDTRDAGGGIGENGAFCANNAAPAAGGGGGRGGGAFCAAGDGGAFCCPAVDQVLRFLLAARASAAPGENTAVPLLVRHLPAQFRRPEIGVVRFTLSAAIRAEAPGPGLGGSLRAARPSADELERWEIPVAVCHVPAALALGADAPRATPGATLGAPPRPLDAGPSRSWSFSAGTEITPRGRAAQRRAPARGIWPAQAGSIIHRVGRWRTPSFSQSFLSSSESFSCSTQARREKNLEYRNCSDLNQFHKNNYKHSSHDYTQKESRDEFYSCWGGDGRDSYPGAEPGWPHVHRRMNGAGALPLEKRRAHHGFYQTATTSSEIPLDSVFHSERYAAGEKSLPRANAICGDSGGCGGCGSGEKRPSGAEEDVGKIDGKKCHLEEAALGAPPPDSGCAGSVPRLRALVVSSDWPETQVEEEGGGGGESHLRGGGGGGGLPQGAPPDAGRPGLEAALSAFFADSPLRCVTPAFTANDLACVAEFAARRRPAIPPGERARRPAGEPLGSPRISLTVRCSLATD